MTVTLLDVASGPTFSADGPRVALVGDTRDIVDALDGAPKDGLSVRVLGKPLPSWRVGVARRHGAFFADLTPREHVAWSARLSGMSSDVADVHARVCCEKAGFGRHAARRMGALAPPFVKLTLAAAAVVTEPDVLVCEGLLDDVDHQWAGFLLGALVALLGDKAAILTISDIASEGPRRDLVVGCDQTFVITGSTVEPWARPDEAA